MRYGERFGQCTYDRVLLMELEDGCGYCGSEPGDPCVVLHTRRAATFTHQSRCYAALAKVREVEKRFIAGLVHAGGAS